jgi:2,3-bisphosphoglycerate-independent phosphoglycerate mutase
MKYCILIIDGAASSHSFPSGSDQSRTGQTPHLDALAKAGLVGKALTVPQAMEPSRPVPALSIMVTIPGLL